MKLTVVIVSYNVRYYLEQCLHSLERALQGVESQVYVVDNHSSDESVPYLSKRFPKVNFIDSNHNLGFARANNIAIRQTASQYVLLLNPDTFVSENVVSQALAFMDENPLAGAVGAMMHNADGTRAPESRRGLPTPLVALQKMLGNNRRYYMSHLPWDEPCQIDIVSGAFCLLRREALDKVGLLDETFFMYGEDIDLSYRLTKGGYQNWYLPLPIVHYKGESTQKSSFRYVHVFYQAMLIFFRKHYGHLNILLTLPIKAAIYLRATTALAGMLYRRVRRSLGFFDRHSSTPAFLLMGSEEMKSQCRQLLARKGLQEATTVARGVCLVFDTSAYSFQNIIAEMSRRSSVGVVLGTYNCATQVLITPAEIIK